MIIVAELALIVDYKYCFGCHVCDVACRKEHQFNDDEFGITISEQGPLHVGEKWIWNYLPTPTSLCDLCADRLAAGLDPTCVHHCLAKCIEIVPLENAVARLAELGNSACLYIVK